MVYLDCEGEVSPQLSSLSDGGIGTDVSEIQGFLSNRTDLVYSWHDVLAVYHMAEEGHVLTFVSPFHPPPPLLNHGKRDHDIEFFSFGYFFFGGDVVGFCFNFPTVRWRGLSRDHCHSLATDRRLING